MASRSSSESADSPTKSAALYSPVAVGAMTLTLGDAAIYRVIHRAQQKPYILLLFPNKQSRSILFANLLNHLSIPGVAEMIDIVQSTANTYYIFRDTPGMSLSEYLVENYEMEEKDVVELGNRLCKILLSIETARPGQTLDHLAPCNIFIGPNNDCTIVPTGFQSQDNTFTTTGLSIGEQFYYAPEKLKNGISNPRTSVYALGAILYATVVGRDPARQPHVFYPLRKQNSVLSKKLEQIILKCMDPDPGKRYPSILQLHRQLTRLNNAKPSFLSLFKKK